MLRRFVAAASVSGVAIACGATGSLFVPALAMERAYPLTLLWCFVPLAWGLWAMCAPESWVPRRFPAWGAILGLIVGIMAALVLNIPAQVLGRPVAAKWRVFGVLIAIVMYTLLWTIVRAIYRALARPLSGQLVEMRASPQKPGVPPELSQAHGLLQDLRKRIGAQPELDELIERVEHALSVLTMRTGGML